MKGGAGGRGGGGGGMGRGRGVGWGGGGVEKEGIGGRRKGRRGSSSWLGCMMSKLQR